MRDRTRVAVVGGGGVGTLHVEGFQSLPERFEVVAICDVDEGKARQVAEASGIPRVVTDFRALCRTADLDVLDL